MISLFQRIIQNHFQWTKPSPGRLGPSGEGEYVQKNGFGHEDWNFNKNLLIDDCLYGYCYYKPTDAKKAERFNIAFATYTNRRWYLIGFYLNCEFVENPPVINNIISQKMNDMLQLGQSLGSEWSKLSNNSFLKKMKWEAQWLKWRVKPSDAIRTSQPIEIPKNIFHTKNYRIVKPTEINKGIFDSFYALALQQNPDIDYADESEFPEGKEIEAKHKLKERNQLVVIAAKEAFKRKHGKLYCQICNFNFYSSYGEIGQDYIEGHHVLPLSMLAGNSKTKIKDIALVCSNCHRMLHRRRPWLSLSELSKLINC